MAVVAFVVFSLLYLTPGDPAAIIAGDIATDEDIRRIRAQLGLDEPFLVQFGALGVGAAARRPRHVDLHQPSGHAADRPARRADAVADAVHARRLDRWSRCRSASSPPRKAGTWVDRAVMAFSVLGFSVPVFVLAYILILRFSIELDWLPVQGYRQLARRRRGSGCGT